MPNETRNLIPVFHPENLNLENLFSLNPPNFPYSADKFRYLIDRLTTLPAYLKIKDASEFVPLRAVKIQKDIRNYKDYLSYLIAHKIIESDGIYVPNEKSIGYRFTETYRTKVKLSFIIDRRLCNKLSKRTKLFFTGEEYNHLGKWFNESLEIDYDGAREFNESLFEENLVTKTSFEAIRRYNNNYVHIEQFTRGNYHLSCDDTSKRIHTNFTCVNKGLLKYISYDGIKLRGSDLKCSQPFFFSLLLNKHFYKDVFFERINLKQIQVYNHHGNVTLDIQSSVKEEIVSTIIACSLKPEEENDIKNYIAEVKKGSIYKSLDDLFCKVTGRSLGEKKIKIKTFQVFYSHNDFKSKECQLMCDVFEKEYPYVYKIIKLLKKDRHNTLAILMQSIESFLFIEKISRRIAEEFPDLPIYPIHDSILTLQGREEDVAKIIREEIYEATELTPELTFD